MFQEQVSLKALQQFNRFSNLHARVTALRQNVRIKQAVKCPVDVALNDWIAVHTILFYNQLNIIFGNISSHICTDEGCPIMNAGPKYQYLWADGKTILDPINCSAPAYVNYLLSWIESMFQNESLVDFSNTGTNTSDRLVNVKTILKRLFRVYCHVYYSHFKSFAALGGETYLNSSLRHFVFFVEEFSLVDANEMKPLAVLIETFHEKELLEKQIPNPATSLEDPSLMKAVLKSSHSTEAENQDGNDSGTFQRINRITSFVTHDHTPPAPSTETKFNFESILPPPRLDSMHHLSINDERSKEESIQQGPYKLSNLSEEELAEVKDTLAPLPSDSSPVKPPGYHSSSFDEEPVSEMYFDSYLNEKQNDLPSSSLPLDGFSPRAAIMGIGWDFEKQLSGLCNAGYEITHVWTDNMDAFNAKHGSVNGVNFTLNLDDILSSDVDLVLIQGDEFAKRKDSLLISIIEHCQEMKISFGLAPCSLSLAKRREMFECLQQKAGDTGNDLPISFVCHPWRFMENVERVKTQLGSIGQVLNFSLSFNSNWRILGVEDTEYHKKRAINDIIANCLDLFFWMVETEENITEITTKFEIPKYDVSDYAVLSVKGTLGCSGTISVSLLDEFPISQFELKVTGKKGTLIMTDSVLTIKTINGTASESFFTSSFQDSFILINMYNKLKLHLFAEKNQDANFSKTDMHLMESLYTTLPTIHDGYRNMRIVEAIRRQQMMPVDIKTALVSEILKISPKALKKSQFRSSTSAYGSAPESRTNSKDVRNDNLVYNMMHMDDSKLEMLAPPPPLISNKDIKYERELPVEFHSEEAPSLEQTPISQRIGWFDDQEEEYQQEHGLPVYE